MKVNLQSITNQLSDQISTGRRWVDPPSLELVDRGRDGSILTFKLSGIVDVTLLAERFKNDAMEVASDGFCIAEEIWEVVVWRGEIESTTCQIIRYKAVEQVAA